METCYKLFKTSIIKNITLNEKRFGFEPEITTKIARIKNIRIYEVGISYYGRTYAEGKRLIGKMVLGPFIVSLDITYLHSRILYDSKSLDHKLSSFTKLFSLIHSINRSPFIG